MIKRPEMVVDSGKIQAMGAQVLWHEASRLW